MHALVVGVALWCAAVTPEEPVLLVEVSSGDEGNGVTPKEIAALEDTVALGFNSEFLRVETRRQRQSRVPPQVYWHQEALLSCANPRWIKARVIKCIQGIAFPYPAPKQPRLLRATHLLRISRAVTPEAEILALSLTPLGKNAVDQVERRELDRNATPADRRAVVLEMASKLLGPLRP